MRSILIAVIAATFALTGCENKPSAEGEADTSATAEAPAVEADKEVEGDAPADANEKVVVAAAGTTFEPPVSKDQIPDGAYICDMGTVHYAQMEKGDGKCPECGMMLKVHGVAKAESPTGGAAADHDHDHAGEGHEHGHDGDDHHGHDH